MANDAELLRQYSESGSEAAFSEFVRRHLNVVYFAALRRTGGNAVLAQDIAQYVFTEVARKTGALARHASLTGWLYTTTRFAAAKACRSARARQRWERAGAMSELTASEPSFEWERLRPVIDEVLDALDERDREAILVRFFENRPFAEIGALLRISEDAARMRIDRALEKLRLNLERRGIKSTAAAIGAGLAAQGGLTAPAGLVATITAGAIAAGAASGVLLGLLGTMKFALGTVGVAACASVGMAVNHAGQARAALAAREAAVEERTEAIARRVTAEKNRDQASSPISAPRDPVPRSIRAEIAAQDDMWERLYRVGQDFLVAHPEARPLVDQMHRSHLESAYGRVLIAIGISGSDYENALAAARNSHTGNAGIGSMAFRFGPPDGGAFDRADGKLHQLIGTEQFRRYSAREMEEKIKQPIKTLVIAAYDSDAALLPAQAVALSSLLDRHTVVKEAFRNVKKLAVDWPAVAADSASVLSPAQWELFKDAIARDGKEGFFGPNVP